MKNVCVCVHVCMHLFDQVHARMHPTIIRFNAP